MERNYLCHFGRKHHKATILGNYFEFEEVVQEERLSKDFSYLELRQPFCSAKHDHLCNSGRAYYEEQFFDFILNLSRWFR